VTGTHMAEDLLKTSHHAKDSMMMAGADTRKTLANCEDTKPSFRSILVVGFSNCQSFFPFAPRVSRLDGNISKVILSSLNN
jgi:hypothetical protein